MSAPVTERRASDFDPFAEIRMTTLHSMRGVNYWSKRPATRMDVLVGAFDDISSDRVQGLTEALAGAMPGLWEHHCSIGERGGFITRLRRGTYAPHIMEHVALELQSMIGHRVGYGRTRGGDVDGEYTLVFEHEHEQVGLRAAALALDIVQRAFARTLTDVTAAVRELEDLAATPDAPPLTQRVMCGITGGGPRAEAQSELMRLLAEQGTPDALVIDVSPAYLLQSGIPYARADMAIVLDTDLTDVPDRYRERDRANRLLEIMADVVRRDGVMILPSGEYGLHDYARDEDCRVGVFTTDSELRRGDLKTAAATATVRDGEIVIEHCGDPVTVGRLRDDMAPAAQVAAALAAHMTKEHCTTPDR
jgi:cyanophycin synthetase